MTLLTDARNDWADVIRSTGGYCPCCDRWGKMYRRSLNVTMARSIVWLANHTVPGGDWIDVPRTAPRWMIKTNQFATTHYWTFCERSVPNPEDDKKHTGLWRITDLGNRWAKNLVRIPKYVWIYDDTVHGFEDPKVAVSEILDHFSYNDIMNTSYYP